MANETIYFATNRDELKNAQGITIGFGDKLNPVSPAYLRFGAAEVAPPTKKNPDWSVQSVQIAPESIPGVTTDDPSAQKLLGSAAVFEALRQRLITAGSAKGGVDLILLLHGYASSFDNALARAAEIKRAYAAKQRAVEVAVFCWPSDGSLTPLIAYKSDRDDARSSAKAVARALLFFFDYLRRLTADQMCQARLNLLAHSMGNYVLRNAVQAIISEFGGKRLPRAFTHIFLMAADEDDDALNDTDKLARLPEMAEAVHVYFAASDRALSISDVTKGNPDRLGSAGPHTLTNLPQKITLIDCDQVCETTLLDANHQYYRKRPEVLADICAVLDGTRPEAIPGRVWVPARGAFVVAAKP